MSTLSTVDLETGYQKTQIFREVRRFDAYAEMRYWEVVKRRYFSVIISIGIPK
jgi:hypothetical protein